MSTKPLKVARAAVYVRQSINNPDGIEAQIKNCKKLCASRGWEVVEIYEDNDVSAYKKRGAGTAWGKMLQAIESNDFDVVVSVNLDRLLRGLSDLTTLIEKGAKILTVDGEIDLTSAEGEFQATFLAALARFETKRKSERQLRANIAKASKGRPVPTRRRFGYETDGCTPRSDEASIVVSLFEGFSEGKSIRSMAMELKDKNATVGGGKSWSPGRVRNILSNPFYAGRAVHLGAVSESTFVVPIVSRELFDTTNAILKDPSRRINKGNQIRHLLSGIAICGVCGAKMNYSTGYKCNVRNDHAYIRKETLESAVLEFIETWMATNRDKPWAAFDSARMKKLLKESGSLASESRRLTNLLILDGIDKGEVQKALKFNSEKFEEVQSSISEQRSKTALSQSIEIIREFWSRPVDWSNFDSDRTDNRFGFKSLDGKAIELTEENYEDYARDFNFFEGWKEVWNGMPLNLQRELIKALFEISVDKGRKLDRVKIQAKSLKRN